MGTRERVLVTGGSGFIGACLVRELIAAGRDVHLMLRPESQTWRLTDVEGGYTRHDADLRDAEAVRSAVRASRPDVIYHLAATGTFHFQCDRAAILTVNVLGTMNLLEALESQDYRALIYTGSSSEYGHKDRPMRADDRLDPRSEYAIGKVASALLCQAAAYRGRPNTVVRVFSAYGPWEDPKRIASYVMGCCVRGEAPRVTSGLQPRDFVYVEDVTALLRTAADEPKVHGRILLAGTGQRQTVRDMVETVVAVCGGKPAEYGAEPPRSDEPAVWQADIEETTALTGWRPRYDLRAGVEQMWAWFRANGGRAAA
jgi:nucleoside-diphosphate-sugar epimerase